MFEDDNETLISLRFYERVGGESTDITMNIETMTYTEIVEKFRWFLQAIGYTYIANVAVFDDKGKELFSTHL